MIILYTRITALATAVVFISSCNNGGENSEQSSQEGSTDALSVTSEISVLTEALVNLPIESAASGGAGLVIETVGDCTTAAGPVSLAIFSRDAQVGLEPAPDSMQTGRNVTAYTKFSLDADSAMSDVEVISHTDSQLDLLIQTPDIIAITAAFAGSSVTDFIAAWPADAPDSAILVAEHNNNVCLYSMRLPGFCGTTRTTGASVQVSFNEQVLDVSGCMINQAPDLPLLSIN